MATNVICARIISKNNQRKGYKQNEPNHSKHEKQSGGTATTMRNQRHPTMHSIVPNIPEIQCFGMVNTDSGDR